jgi:hypothetical protein
MFMLAGFVDDCRAAVQDREWMAELAQTGAAPSAR